VDLHNPAFTRKGMLRATCSRLAASVLDKQRGAKCCEAGIKAEPLNAAANYAPEVMSDRRQHKMSAHSNNSSCCSVETACTCSGVEQNMIQGQVPSECSLQQLKRLLISGTR